MQTMRANMQPRPDGAGPNGPPPTGPDNADRPHRGFGGKSAGSFLLRLGVSPEKMRALHQQQQQRPPGQ